MNQDGPNKRSLALPARWIPAAHLLIGVPRWEEEVGIVPWHFSYPSTQEKYIACLVIAIYTPPFL